MATRCIKEIKVMANSKSAFDLQKTKLEREGWKPFGRTFGGIWHGKNGEEAARKKAVRDLNWDIRWETQPDYNYIILSAGIAATFRNGRQIAYYGYAHAFTKYLPATCRDNGGNGGNGGDDGGNGGQGGSISDILSQYWYIILIAVIALLVVI